jgi:putative sterol carrier protein
MAEGARQIFENWERRGRESNPALERLRGNYRFDIEEAGHWYLAVEGGRVRVSEEDREADCVIECTEGEFLRIIRGEQNLLTALLQGRINITGDMALAQKFYGLVRSASRPPAAPGSR